MLILRIKQAECALDDGRLDEAYGLLSAGDLRAHRRGQDLAGRLAEALVSRGREHLAAGRLGQADDDCQKASRVAGNTAQVAELRSAIVTARATSQETLQQNARALAAARQELQVGRLSACQQILRAVDPVGSAATLMADVAHQRTAIDAVIARADECLARDDWEAAIDQVAAAPAAAVSDLRFREITGRIGQRVSQRIAEALKSGRLDLADALLLRLERVVGGTLEAEALRRTMEQCRLVWNNIMSGQLRQAEAVARRLLAMLPDAAWVESAITAIHDAEQAMDVLRSGPLGLFESTAMNHTIVSPSPAMLEPVMPDAIPSGPRDTAMPARFVLQVDGAGSFCVLRERTVRVGPISSSPACDVGLLADPATPAVTIERRDDDYFLRAPLPVDINDRPAVNRLLASGDRIALSARCHLAFRVPSAASTSAVLDLSGARMSRVDIRRVILLGRELIIGPGPAAHVRCDELASPVVLLMREGRLLCQSRLPIMLDGKPAGTQAVMSPGAHVRAGELNFVITSL